MALIQGDPEAIQAYQEHKAKALAKTAPARKRADAAKAAYNAGKAKAPGRS